MTTIADRHAKNRIKSIHDDIAFWRREAREATSDVWMIALGVAYGLTLARDQWMNTAPVTSPARCSLERSSDVGTKTIHSGE